MSELLLTIITCLLGVLVVGAGFFFRSIIVWVRDLDIKIDGYILTTERRLTRLETIKGK